MSPRRIATSLAAGLTAAALLSPVPVEGQAGGALGTVRIARTVVANGQPLAAGSYGVRVTDLPVKPVLGQTPREYRWVEFVQKDDVKGRELALVLTGPEAEEVINSPAPADGRHRIDVLREDRYVRLWFNRGGVHYLMHLAPPVPPGGH
jgi:hypothetical protein